MPKGNPNILKELLVRVQESICEADRLEVPLDFRIDYPENRAVLSSLLKHCRSQGWSTTWRRCCAHEFHKYHTAYVTLYLSRPRQDAKQSKEILKQLRAQRIAS